MRLSILPLLLAAACILPIAFPARAQVFVVGEKTATADVTTEFHPTHVQLPTTPLDQLGRLTLVRGLESEQGFAHREIPFGAGLILLANGNMTPSGEAYRRMIYEKGQSASPGDRVVITALHFKPGCLVLDFNGGPFAKHRFLSHLSLNDSPLAVEGPVATGFRITLVFEGEFPELTALQVKALLDPLIDFHAHSSAEAYADTLPPLARAAVAAHRILVGMDRRMVLASVGEPRDKEREHAVQGDPNSPEYEEWIYGQPPQPTRFVRFEHNRVVRLEIAVLGQPVEIHDHNELGDQAAPILRTRTIANGDPQPGEGQPQPAPPSLRLPGEKDGPAPAYGRVKLPPSPTQSGSTPIDSVPTSSVPTNSAPPILPQQPQPQQWRADIAQR